MANLQVATLAGGCFWCIESAFNTVEGVEKAVSGYAGGEDASPTYETVCGGGTGHAEVVQVTYDADNISYREILEIFFALHDPTQLNRQGNDVGTQYRSTIMYLTEEQKTQSIRWKGKLAAKFEDPIVTQIVPAPIFYPAEEYHQDYYKKNPNQGYCSLVIRPKLKKLNLE